MPWCPPQGLGRQAGLGQPSGALGVLEDLPDALGADPSRAQALGLDPGGSDPASRGVEAQIPGPGGHTHRDARAPQPLGQGAAERR
eukprot:2584747-Lingulodinium_polyedra.AAC.1